MEHGGRRVTSKDVALAAGVSQQTVSRILSGNAPAMVSEVTRQRVQRLAAELGYVPNAAARQLRQRRANALGLMLPSAGQHITAFYSFTQLLTGIAEEAEATGYTLVICPGGAPQQQVKLIRTGQVDGALVMLPLVDDPRLAELARIGAPTVWMNEPPEGVPVSWVDFDNVAAARGAVTHLLARGHRRVGFIGWAGLLNAELRLRGYREALVSHGLAPDEELVVRAPEPREATRGAEAMRQLLALARRPTAVFCSGDFLAFGAMHVAQAAGLRLPDDLAIVGVDDEPASAYQRPPLTTVRPPFRAKGRAAARLLIDLIEGRVVAPAARRLPTELIVRESS